ncbi:MAG TPA: DUF6599 family protein [Bryobacteraceae bacterium]|jgi:hypothetical protein|nr:DUF6599 family protein [Bryobacteraceae bacterium]
MLRSKRLALGLFIASVALAADDPAVHDSALWKEFGLVHTQTANVGKVDITAYQMKDLTGALAAWEWQRSPEGRTCQFAEFCTQEPDKILVSQDNYVVEFRGKATKAEIDQYLAALPNKRGTSLPAILTFLPHQGLVPDSARYVLGPESLKAFAPQLDSTKPGFEQGAEAEIAEYNLPHSATPIHLALFYYPSPEMARLHAINFKLTPGTQVKRSGVLDAIVYGNATQAQVDTLLSRIEYEAKITWNDSPPPGPIKPLYRLLTNIIYLSILLSAICLLAGLMYAGMRIYRRRYGTLDSQEAMTTLHLTGE